jgi:hypothetical protein
MKNELTKAQRKTLERMMELTTTEKKAMRSRDLNAEQEKRAAQMRAARLPVGAAEEVAPVEEEPAAAAPDLPPLPPIVDITDPEQNLYLQVLQLLYDLSFKLRKYKNADDLWEWFQPHWDSFARSLDPLNAGNYPNVIKQVLRLFEMRPMNGSTAAVFNGVLDAFIAETYYKRGFKPPESLTNDEFRARFFGIMANMKSKARSKGIPLPEMIHETLREGRDELMDARALGLLSSNKRCHYCGRFTPTDLTDLKVCPRCRSVSYCSRACQEDDWDQHRAQCAEWMQRREAAEAAAPSRAVVENLDGGGQKTRKRMRRKTKRPLRKKNARLRKTTYVR